LDLLESDAERFAELFLTHADEHATHAHATSDVPIDRVGRLGQHHLPLRERLAARLAG
jgi:hypothetical protein